MIQLVRMYIEEAEHFFIGGSPRIDQWLRRWFLVDRMRYSVACGLHNTSATLPTLLFKVLLYWLTGWCYDSTLDVAYQIRCCDSEWMLSAHCSSFTPNPSQTVATSRWNHVLTLFHDLSSSHARRHAGLESAPCLPLPRTLRTSYECPRQHTNEALRSVPLPLCLVGCVAWWSRRNWTAASRLVVDRAVSLQLSLNVSLAPHYIPRAHLEINTGRTVAQPSSVLRRQRIQNFSLTVEYRRIYLFWSMDDGPREQKSSCWKQLFWEGSSSGRVSTRECYLKMLSEKQEEPFSIISRWRNEVEFRRQPTFSENIIDYPVPTSHAARARGEEQGYIVAVLWADQ